MKISKFQRFYSLNSEKYSSSRDGYLTNNSNVDDYSDAILKVLNERNPRTIRELISIVKQDIPISEKAILTEVLKLQNQGKLKIRNNSSERQGSLSTYLNNNHALWYQIVIGLSIITLVASTLIDETFYPLNYLRNILGIIFVLWLPGYAFIRAVFPSFINENQKSSNLHTAEIISLSVVMSLAIVIIIVFILNFLPTGIQLIPIVFSLLIFTSITATVAVIREYRIRKKGFKVDL